MSFLFGDGASGVPQLVARVAPPLASISFKQSQRFRDRDRLGVYLEPVLGVCVLRTAQFGNPLQKIGELLVPLWLRFQKLNRDAELLSLIRRLRIEEITLF